MILQNPQTMKNFVRPFVIVPALPEALEPLRALAYNLWWCWNPPAVDLFRRLDVELWERVKHNPVRLLAQVDQQRLEQLANDDAYMAQLYRVADSFYVYMNGRKWFDEKYPDLREQRFAYFSAEFGLHESMPIYSGGLGVLAGDHLKSASDLGVPLVAVGLMYRQGYFQQQLSEDGWQLESYPAYDFHEWPTTLCLQPDGRAVKIAVQIGNQQLNAQVWRVAVGRVDLYLLDADLPENPPELRAVTGRLYGGDERLRIRQEILLGIGGYRALVALGLEPKICHMNEGHAAFLALERIRHMMRTHSLSYREAREAAVGGNIFTTHTPVPAGIDRFNPQLVIEHLGWMAQELGMSNDDFQLLGREFMSDPNSAFCMPILALRTSYRNNAVSELHGEVARGMWQSYWPGVPKREVPITHVTNGVHTRSWISSTMNELLEQYLGPNWAETPHDDPLWDRILEIPDAELWRVHVRRREQLIAEVRRRLRDQLRGRGAPPAEVKAAEEVLDPAALTVGFARRFAPYKRATLLFKNLDRLREILSNTRMPVQFIFAGKSHPADRAGKELIKAVALACARPEFRRKIVFIENYDIGLARALVQGVDLWLNNPIRLQEASGTSGMKVPINGGLNLSALDGWWPEAYNGRNGWAIGDGRSYDDANYQDHVESESLYNLLEREIIPLFYRRTEDDLPRKWLARVKESMRTIIPQFSTNRMLRDYATKLYLPAVQRATRMADDGFSVARKLAAWKDEIRYGWHQVRVLEVKADGAGTLRVGDELPIEARIQLGQIKPDSVAVEVYYGPIDATGDFLNGTSKTLAYAGATANGEHLFKGTIPCTGSGQHGYAVRVLPSHADVADRYDQGLVVWG
jgi:starch phosphorylase